jgi:uncharacterized small protein (DUF1192 family)
MFPLIFNGSQIMSEAPHDTERDMAGPESETDVEALIDELIERVGLDEAIRRLEARKPKKRRGRSDYLAMDIGLIWLAGSLQEEMEKTPRPFAAWQAPPNTARTSDEDCRFVLGRS